VGGDLVRYAASKDIIAMRLSEGDDIHESIKQVCTENNIDSAVILSALGMVSSVTFGWFTGNEYLTETNSETLELVAITGDVSYKGDTLYPHLHATFNRPDHSVISGHILQAKVHNNAEIFLLPLSSIILNRQFDGWFEALAPEKR